VSEKPQKYEKVHSFYDKSGKYESVTVHTVSEYVPCTLIFWILLVVQNNFDEQFDRRLQLLGIFLYDCL
jgi:hypothetical protein